MRAGHFQDYMIVAIIGVIIGLALGWILARQFGVPAAESEPPVPHPRSLEP